MTTFEKQDRFLIEVVRQTESLHPSLWTQKHLGLQSQVKISKVSGLGPNYIPCCLYRYGQYLLNISANP